MYVPLRTCRCIEQWYSSGISVFVFVLKEQTRSHLFIAKVQPYRGGSLCNSYRKIPSSWICGTEVFFSILFFSIHCKMLFFVNLAVPASRQTPVLAVVFLYLAPPKGIAWY